MAKKCASSSSSRSKAPVGRGAGHGTTSSCSRSTAHQTRAQTRAPNNPQPEIANGVMRLLNVLEALVPNHGRLPVPQMNSQAQTQ
ncbi:hypothetical protein HAX54_041681, partial [Datura stramonium]|nr:hypothetical protein [Datura stramonium]